ncbi:MAG: hypothetical protein H3C51_04930 [Rubellimicrobium sp.]|nr:hypothetical protein [Rubellimicrobium sp.]
MVRAGLRLAAIWAAAFLLAGAMLAPFARGNDDDMALGHEAATLAASGPEAVFIGSSLIGAAVPPVNAGGPETPDLDWQRLFRNGADRHDLLIMAEAVTPYTRFLFVEAAALLRAGGSDAVWPASVLFDFSRHLRNEARAVADVEGADLLDLRRESEFVDRDDPVGPRSIPAPDPLPVADLARWRALAEVLAARGGALVLVDPPRVDLVLTRSDRDRRAQEQDHARTLAGQMGAGLFQPAPWWEAGRFTTGGHMNRAGRARFVQEFAAWLERHDE